MCRMKLEPMKPAPPVINKCKVSRPFCSSHRGSPRCGEPHGTRRARIGLVGGAVDDVGHHSSRRRCAPQERGARHQKHDTDSESRHPEPGLPFCNTGARPALRGGDEWPNRGRPVKGEDALAAHLLRARSRTRWTDRSQAWSPASTWHLLYTQERRAMCTARPAVADCELRRPRPPSSRPHDRMLMADTAHRPVRRSPRRMGSSDLRPGSSAARASGRASGARRRRRRWTPASPRSGRRRTRSPPRRFSPR